MMSIATALHALAAVVWVGGMFFAYMAMRPAVGPLAPAERLALWRRTFDRFFLWVWVSIAVLLVTGYWIVFGGMGGFGGAGVHIHVMQATGLLMVALFLHMWFAPFGRLRKALAASDLKRAAAQIDQIRMIVGINLILGLVTVAIGASGRYWG